MNAPQTSLGKSLAEIRSRINAADLANLSIDDIQRALRGDDEPKQPAALARLEAWLAEDINRRPEITNLADLHGRRYWRVALINDGRDGPCVFGYENPNDGKTTFYPAYAKAPGLAATIDAALVKAEEVKL